MGEQMKNAPVYFVIGQVRFNHSPVPINEKITEIQEGFRKLGFPDYKPQKLQQMSIVLQNNQLIQSPGDLRDSFEFANAQRTVLLRLEPSQLSLQAVEYTTFEDFSAKFAAALDLLTSSISLAFIERVGLRFLDAVMPREGEDLKQYLHPQLLGLSALGDGLDTTFSLSETLMSRGEDSILARVVIQEGGIGLPHDLANAAMELEPRFLNHTGVAAILDNDAFYAERLIFESDGPVTAPVMEVLERLKALVDTVFRKSITEHAASVWEGAA